MPKDVILPEEFPRAMESIYAGFWRRLAALIVDWLILMPVSLVIVFLNELGRMYVFMTALPSFMIMLFAFVYCVKQWGGSPGKLVTGICIIRADGGPIGWWEAVLRSLVVICLVLVMNFASLSVVYQMSNELYSSMGFIARAQWMAKHAPGWQQPVQYFQSIWFLLGAGALLLNKRKRAIHDFIAGTVVIKKRFLEDCRNWYERGPDSLNDTPPESGWVLAEEPD